MTELLSRFKLPAGTDKTGRTFELHIGYDPGMKELVQIVAGLQIDVKRINKCLTLEVAQNYIKGKKNWGAYEEDITGPNGKPDGIKEVFVTNAQGNVKVINGYELGKTDYPTCKAYYSTFPTKADRKGHSYSEFKQCIHEIGPGLTPDEEPAYDMDYDNFGGEQFESIQKPITPKDLFKQYIFKPYYDSKKDQFKQANVTPMKQAQLFNKGLSKCYNLLVRDEIFRRHNLDPKTMKQSEINKITKSKDYKIETYDYLRQILSQPEAVSNIQRFMDEKIMGDVENDVL